MDKYRVWHKEHKKMYEAIGFIHLPDERTVVFVPIESDAQYFFAEDVAIMRHVGGQDCNKVDIYEGDIVKNITDSGYGDRVVVEFPDGIACGSRPFIELAGGGWQRADFDECKVIGNIWEHPEKVG